MPLLAPGRRVPRLVLAVLVVLVVVVTAAGCSDSATGDEDVSTDTSSTDLATADERIEFLATYVELPTPVTDTNFHIVYNDNSSGRVPGPSDWDMQVAVRVAPGDVEAWTDGYTATPELDIAWSEPLVADWGVESEPAHFERAGSTVSVYAPEGIVVKRITST